MSADRRTRRVLNHFLPQGGSMTMVVLVLFASLNEFYVISSCRDGAPVREQKAFAIGCRLSAKRHTSAAEHVRRRRLSTVEETTKLAKRCHHSFFLSLAFFEARDPINCTLFGDIYWYPSFSHDKLRLSSILFACSK